MNENIANTKPVHLDFISPTPAHAATHQMEITHVKLLNRFHPRITASWRAIPAPQHLIKINELPADHKKYTLPIVPNTDFIPARMVRFPGLNEDMVHPGALKYYKEMEITIGEPIQLRRMG